MRAAMCRESENKGKESERAYWEDVRWKEKKVDGNEWLKVLARCCSLGK